MTVRAGSHLKLASNPKTCVLRLMSGADDTSLRMRLVAQPGDLAADETWRVRLLASAGAKGIRGLEQE